MCQACGCDENKCHKVGHNLKLWGVFEITREVGRIAVGQNDPQIISDVNRAWSEEIIISVGVVEAFTVPAKYHDRDKLRQRRNSSIQSKCLENNREQVND